MKGDRWQDLERKFAELVELEPETRREALEQIGTESPELRRELEQLLAHDEAPDELSRIVERAARAASAEADEVSAESRAALSAEASRTDQDPRLGREIDGYRIESVLGEGGFGVVYRALQERPVARRVALKIVKPGLGSDAVLRRFALERQAMAAMGHPSIAQVFDAGTTDGGSPYFVMEWVDGEPIASFCDRRSLGLGKRLDLFEQVCAGVQHAHQRGVLHRDLKPSNILVAEVDGVPQVKIIDFGIAKSLHGELDGEAQREQLTERQQVVGTLEYMSPEQASFDPRQVDVRSDIYSLGVLLYELLTGVVPFPRRELERLALDEALRRIREAEPAKPSTRSHHLGPRLRGDLDWIVLKALDKDKDRRYGAVASLRADLQRHRRDLPVEAGPPSRSYRFGKFYRRHRASVLAAGLGLVSLVGALAVAVLSLERVSAERDRAIRAEERASREAETSRQVSDFLVEIFEVADPELAQGRDVLAREIVDRGSSRMERLAASEPEAAARLLTVLGTVYSSLGLYDEAAAQLEKALELAADPVAGSRDPKLELARVRLFRNETETAERGAREVLEQRRQHFGNHSVEAAEALSLLADIRYSQSDTTHVKLVEEGLDIRRAILGESDPAVAESLAALARNAGWFNDWETASGHLKRALEILESTSGPLHPKTLAVRSELVRALSYRRAAAEALPLANEAIEAARRVFGEEHPAFGDALANRGTAHYRATRDHEAALADFSAALEVLGKTFEPTHPRVNEILRRRGFALRALGRHDEAVDVQQQVLRRDLERLGPDHGMVRRQYFNLALAAQGARRHDMAVEYLLKHNEFGGKTDWKEELGYARSMHHLGISLTALGRFREAEDYLLRAHSLLVAAYGPDHRAVKDQVEKLIPLYEQWRKPTERDRWQAELERIAATTAASPS